MYWHLEPIQSRCAVLRYSKLTDAQVLKRLLEVCEAESVSYTDDGLEAIVFTAQGDMRQVEKSHSPLYHSPEKSWREMFEHADVQIFLNATCFAK